VRRHERVVEVRLPEGHRADEHTVDAESEHLLDRRGVAEAAPELQQSTGRPLGRQPPHDLAVGRRTDAGAGRVEVHDVERPSARAPEAPSRVERIRPELGRRREPSLDEADDAPVDQVDGRDDLEGPGRAAPLCRLRHVRHGGRRRRGAEPIGTSDGR
jgi:hypothetical protein